MKKNIVFIPKDQIKTTTSEHSINSWKSWSHKNNYEFLILEESICKDPSFDKFFIFDLLEEANMKYDQILLANSDTIINPNSPNIFDLSDRKLCGIFYDSSYDFLFKNIENYSKYIFEDYIFPYWEYLDTGILVLNEKHKEFINLVKNYYLENLNAIENIKDSFKIGSDQPIFNFLMHLEKVDFKILPYEWNMQDMIRKEAISNNNPLLFTDIGWIYQFNFLSGHKDYLMKNTYEKLYR